MFHDIKIEVSGSRKIEYKKSTKIQAQNIFESFLVDGVDFTMTVKQYVHDHLWQSSTRYSDGSIDFVCDDCEESFKLSQTLLTACSTGAARAQENGF